MKKLTLLLSLSLMACGSEPDVSTILTDSPGAGHAVSSASELPECGDDTRGLLYYVEDDQEFKVCKSSGWVAIQVTGPAGPTGSSGANGSDGISLAVNLQCGKLSGGYYFRYQHATFSDGSAFVSCEVRDNYTTASSSTIYSASQNGAAQGGCTVTMDSEGTLASGWWNFIRSSATATATYNDVGSTINGSVVTFASSDCTSI